MAISFDGIDDYYIISDAVGLTLPDSDWCIGIWTFVSDSAGALYQYIISSGAFGANNTVNIWLVEDIEVTNPDKWLARVQDGGGDFVDIISTTATGADSKWRLIIFQRRDADVEVQIWHCEVGQTASKEASGWDANLDASDGGDWNIGRRTDGDADRYYGNAACEFFKGDFSLSQEEMTALGAGLTVYELGYIPDVYLPMITAEATLYDIFGSNNAARQDAPSTTAEHAPVGTYRKVSYLRIPIQYAQSVVGAVTFAGVVINQVQKVLVGVVTSAGALSEMIGLSLSGVLTFAGVLVRHTSKVLSGVITPTATLTSPSIPILARASRALRVAMTGSPLRGG